MLKNCEPDLNEGKSLVILMTYGDFSLGGKALWFWPAPQNKGIGLT